MMISFICQHFLPRRSRSRLTTRQELIPSTALASLSIGDHRSMWIPKGREILRLYAYLRPAPVTIPEMRLDLFSLRLHRCNPLEIVKGGSRFRTPEPQKSTTD
jgi:hypothetical protein